MKKIHIVLNIVVSAFIFSLAAMAAQPTSESGDADGAIKRGQYIAHAANCIACHSFDKGPYAGGTPFGVAFSPNITPDKKTGIGGYSFDDFEKAVRQGVAKNGFSLSVMMPPSYAIMKDEDLRDLYEFFMHGVPAVSHAIKPINKERKFTVARAVMPSAAAEGEDPVVARGRYLVEGLGHCGFCHTARDEQGVEKAQWSHQGADFLAGGDNYAGWIAINLRGDHGDGMARRSEAELKEFFLTGRNEKTAAFGKMIDIIENSTQYLTEEDATAMARFVKSLPARNPEAKAFEEDRTVAEALQKGDERKIGAAIYVDNCAACHRTDGGGYPRFFPELRGNPVLMSKDPVSLIHITLMGQTLPGLKAAPSSITMPPFGWRLDDEQAAYVLSFIRTSWGNEAPLVDPEDVRAVRANKQYFPDLRILGDSNVDKLLDKQY